MAKTSDTAPEMATVQIPRGLWQKLVVVAETRGLNRPEALEKYAGPSIDREYRKVLAEMNRDLGGES